MQYSLSCIKNDHNQNHTTSKGWIVCFHRRVIFIYKQRSMSGQNKNLFTALFGLKQLCPDSTSLNIVADNQLTH